VRLASSHVKPRGGIAKRCTLSLQLRQRRLLFAAVVSLLLAGCHAAERPSAEAPTPVPQASTASTDTSVTVATVQAAAPPPSAQSSYTVAELESGEQTISSNDPRVARLTNQRISFDALGKRDAVAYASLHDYFLAQHAAALTDALRRSNHQALLAPQDEFEPSAEYDARLQRWMDSAQSIFAEHFKQRQWEVFGIPVRAEDVWYNANTGVVVLPYPPVPGIADLLATEYASRYLEANARAELHGTPLLVEGAVIAPLRCEMRQDVGRLEIPVASAESARAVKQDLISGHAFYYVRFEPEVKRDAWDDYGAFVGSTHRQMRVMKRVDLSLLLRVRQTAVYVSEPPHVLWVFRTGSGRPADLWFLGRGK